MIQIHDFVFNPFMEKTYVLFDDTKEAVIVDPGCYEKLEQLELAEFIDQNNLKVVKLLNTHCHIDHVLGNYFVKEKYNVDLYLHRLDEQVLRSVIAYAPAYGFPTYQETSPDHYLEEGDHVKFGDSVLEVLFTPGHAPGHVVFVNKEQKICIGGDVLFNGSIGRTDLPGGNFDVLIDSIHQKMFSLDDETIVYPGHGESTTIRQEKQSNPFCAIKA